MVQAESGPAPTDGLVAHYHPGGDPHDRQPGAEAQTSRLLPERQPRLGSRSGVPGPGRLVHCPDPPREAVQGRGGPPAQVPGGALFGRLWGRVVRPHGGGGRGCAAHGCGQRPHDVQGRGAAAPRRRGGECAVHGAGGTSAVGGGAPGAPVGGAARAAGGAAEGVHLLAPDVPRPPSPAAAQLRHLRARQAGPPLVGGAVRGREAGGRVRGGLLGTPGAERAGPGRGLPLRPGKPEPDLGGAARPAGAYPSGARRARPQGEGGGPGSD
mmetsp:Transcript_47543/g.114131  ORF Transcript_47543/g.114131 Transcript_47543/m.114131 type:complete len:268 (-) Transcript_47543:699-1502(-)